MVLTRDQLENLSLPSSGVHPLLQVQAQVEKDRLSSRVSLEAEQDHGTWDGRWSLPSRQQFQTLQDLGAMLPTGLPEDHEVCAATARKERQWSQMSEHERRLWSAAATKGWQAYTDNQAVEVLSLKESAAVRRKLAARGELDRILVPRFVLTDKADGLRSEENPMEIEASARLVVPGFRDGANLAGEVRRDAPTGTRLTQHLLLSIIASKGKAWKMMSADVKSAFLKGVTPTWPASSTSRRPMSRRDLGSRSPRAAWLECARGFSAWRMRLVSGGFALAGPWSPKAGPETRLIRLPGSFGAALAGKRSKAW